MPPLPQQDADSFDHRSRFAVQTRTSNPDHLDPPQLQILLAQPVALESRSASMRLVDIELNREALPLPVGVQLELPLAEVHRRRRQPGRLDEVKKPALEPRPRNGEVVAIDGKRLPQSARAGMSTGPSQKGLNSMKVEEPKLFRPLDGSFETSCVEDGSEVEQRSGNCGERNSLASRVILLRQ